jgi:hypothetical protein
MLIPILLIIGVLCLLNYLLKEAKKKRQLSQLGNGGVVPKTSTAAEPAPSYERKEHAMGIADEITKLKQLHDSGALSAHEYETAKARVLAGEGVTAPAKVAEASDVLSILILLLPLAGIVPLWFAWSRISGEFRLFEARSVIDGAQNLAYAATALVLLGSAFLVAIDAARLGFGKDTAPATSSAKHGPLVWAVFLLLLWVVAFPAYFHSRLAMAPKARRLTGAAVGLALLFGGADVGVNWVINERATAVQQQFQRSADEARSQMEETQRNLQRMLGQ